MKKINSRTKSQKSRSSHKTPKVKLRFAVVGIGHIAQVAVLPAFEHAKRDCELVALVSGHLPKADEVATFHSKRATKGKHADLIDVYTYEEYDLLLNSGTIDAVYIALPNNLHYEFVKKALNAGIHVLCEKPFTLTTKQSEKLGELAKARGVSLMIAYRLHFDPANLTAIDLIRSGKIGEPRFFNSLFSYCLKDPDNIRTKSENGGGPLWDIGIYCVNAIRYLFEDEPEEVFAFSSSMNQKMFSEVPESVTASFKFPDGKLASFTCSFGAEASADFQVFGTKGKLELENAYEYTEDRTLTLTVDSKKQVRHFKKTDQFGPELMYFAKCVRSGKSPEPSAWEGMADIKIISALYDSIQKGKAIKLARDRKIVAKPQALLNLEMKLPPVKKVSVVGVNKPH
jgi:predicted dehydrogenase